MSTIEIAMSLFVTLLVVIDPPSLAPILLAVTKEMNKEQRHQTALLASIIAFFILSFSALFGAKVLHALGISLAAFRVSGGLLLFWLGFEMVFSKRTERKQESATTAITKDHIKNIAAFPLAVPLIAGPGAISTSILMSGKLPTLYGHILIFGMIFVAVMLAYLCMLGANTIHKVLGETGNSLLSRLLGLLLVALAIQLVADGVHEFITTQYT